MSLFSHQEIERLRGDDAPPGLTGSGFSAFEFLRSQTMQSAVFEDQPHRENPGQEMRLAVISVWPEVDRASRALQHVDREIRRCARAWADAYDKSSAAADESVFTSPSWFLSELAQFPVPVDVGRGHLTVTAAVAAPTLAVLLDPVQDVFAVLAQWPRSSLAYALSVFGTRGHLTVHRGCVLEVPEDENSFLEMLSSISEGDWGVADVSLPEQQELNDHRLLRRRTIAESKDENGGGTASGVRLVLHRTLADGTQDLFSARVY